MRREDHHVLGEGISPFGTVGVVGIRFATRPTGDGVLQVIEYLDVAVVRRSIESDEFRQTVIVVILVR